MRDTASVSKVELLHPAIRDEVKTLIDKAEDQLPKNMGIRIAQGLRTIEEQDALYAQGRTKPGSIVTKAKGGQSYHNFGLAIDFCLVIDTNGDGKFDVVSWNTGADTDKDGVPDWNEVVKVFTDAGYEWGGAWSTIKDAPHLQKRFGHPQNPSDLLEKYKKGDFITGTRYVTL